MKLPSLAVALAAFLLRLQNPANAQAPVEAGGASKAAKPPALDDLFATLDKDHDGKISREEASGAYSQRFLQWDGNGDGFATRQEIHDFRLRAGIDDKGNRVAKVAPGAPPRAGKLAAILKEPADWRLETMSVPPGFAPEIELTGTEEIRFAPGMFDHASSTYFTCVLAIVVEGAPELGEAQIKDFLEKYYRGLSTSRAQRTGVKVDPAQMKAVVTRSPGSEARRRFEGQVDFFDSFSDGRKIALNVEAQVILPPAKKQTCMILLVSPSAREAAPWRTLREIGMKAESSALEAN